MPVLVIDDNQNAREILDEMLAFMHFQVEQAASGEEGLTKIKAATDKGNPFRMVLLDWKMPGIDGIETGRRIRALTTLPVTPKIILVTAYALDEAQEQLKRANFDGFLVKPVLPANLLEALMRAFGLIDAAHQIQPNANREADLTRPIWGAHILLVEDNEINQQVASEILTGLGLEIKIAENGLEAVKQVNLETFDAVLMDIQMPVLDGFQASQSIRSDAKFKHLPIIAMSASAMTQDREKALEAGMNDHVAKPIDVQRLIKTLLKWVKPGKRALPDGFSIANGGAPIEAKETLPVLPGIDVRKGLAQVGGSILLYKRVLHKFIINQGGAAQAIHDAVNAWNMTEAVRLAHTLKGVAGTIGADRLQASAEELEHLLNANKVKDAAKRIPELSAHLEETLTTLQNVSKDQNHTPSHQVPDIPLILVGGCRSLTVADKIVGQGTADYISMCRPFIREPGLINRWRAGDTAPAKCKSDNLCFGPAMEGKGILCVVAENEKQSS